MQTCYFLATSTYRCSNGNLAGRAARAAQDKRDVPGTSRPFWSDASRLIEEAGSYTGWGSTRTRAARHHFSQGTRGNFFLTAILAQCRTQILIYCTTPEREGVGSL